MPTTSPSNPESRNPSPSGYLDSRYHAQVGGWSEGDSTVLDATDVYVNRDSAVRAAASRNERVVFDAKNLAEIPVPGSSPASSRTNFRLPVDHPLSAMLYAHPMSPIMSAGHDVVQSYLDHAHMVANAIRDNGGVTVEPQPGSEPNPVGSNEWYGVGGATDPDTGLRYPEKVTSGGVNETLAHILDVERGNISLDLQEKREEHLRGAE